MSLLSDEFVNPENLPLEKLTLSVKQSGVVQNVKALDAYWASKRQLTLYVRPPASSSQVFGAIDIWKTKAETYLADLKWLLSLRYHKFWSTILYHPKCMDGLVSFLQEANPPYLPEPNNRDVQKIYAEIRRFVLIAFSRLVTNKESKSEWMSKEFMAELLYNNFIFTIPIIWDLCLVYGVDNGRHLSRLIGGLFSLQPRYEADAAAALAFVKEAFKYIILQVNKDYENDDPPNLPETFKGFSEIKRPTNSKTPDTLTFETLKDLVIHLLDSAMTLRIFLEVHPQSVKIFRKTNFILSIAQLYEYGIPLLYEKLEEVGEKSGPSYAELEGHIDMVREELIDVFREVLAVYKNAILSGEGSVAQQVELCLSALLEVLSEKLLARDYHSRHPVQDDLEVLKQAYPDIDTVKTDFILQAIFSNIDEPIPESALNNERLTNGHAQEETIDNAVIDNPEPSKDNEIPDSVKEESLISEVKDILPHLGDGFILKCLHHYGFNAARVINSVLEDNLAEPLKAIDQSLPIIPEDLLDQKFLETGVQRLNVFDGDEFDLMTRDDVDLQRVHRGKRRDPHRKIGDLLDDNRDIRKRQDIYDKYRMVCDEEAMYSDEYDDTYDWEPAAPSDPAEERRPFVTPRALLPSRRGERQEESEEESDEADEEKAGPSTRNKLDFCANPEEIRQRREAAYHARRGKGPRPPPTRNVDVTGKPKGQGQDKEVLANRDRKEKHKSSRGNHSRRQGAQWKRNQGLVPS